MSNVFFNRSVAKKILQYLGRAKLAGGMRYLVRLDSADMVEECESALRGVLIEQGILGEFVLYSEGGREIYRSFKAVFGGCEVVFAAQVDSKMEVDFLAKLRNRASSDGFAIVFISSHKLDTIDTAIQDLSDLGMPLHESSLRKDLENIIEGNALSYGDRTLLSFALERYANDRYSDMSSVSGYEVFLSIEERGTVEPGDYAAFGLLPDADGLAACTRYNDRKTRERLEDNADRFERIDQAFSRGDFAEKLEGSYSGKFIKDLKERKKNDQHWYDGIEYKDLCSTVKKTDHVDILPSTFEVYSPSNPGLVITPSQWIWKTEGESAARSRKIHFMVFVPEDTDDIAVRAKLDNVLRESHLDKTKQIGATTEKEGTGRRVRSTVKLQNGASATFAQARIDRYVLNIAVLKTEPCYFDSLLSRFFVKVSRRAKNCKLVLSAEDGKLMFNPSGQIEVDEKLVSGSSYACHGDQKLVLTIDEEAGDDSAMSSFSVACGGCAVPMSVDRDARKIPQLTPDVIYREKMVSKQSFKYIDDTHLQLGAREFSLKSGSLSEALELERMIVQNGWLSVNCANGQYSKRDIKLPAGIVNAYEDLLSYFQAQGTLPSLSYLGESRLRELIQRCVDEYGEEISAIGAGASSRDYTDLLEIGAIFCETPRPHVEHTPLHPLNLAYQLQVLDAGLVDAGDDPQLAPALARLGSAHLLPLIRDYDTYYEASDSSGLPEWTVYHPLNSDEARGANIFVARLVESKINDYLNHFSFLFCGLPNHRLRIACHGLGRCEEVLAGIARYLFRQFDKNDASPSDVIKIHVDYYGDPTASTAFEYLFDQEALERFLDDKALINETSDCKKYEYVLLLLEHLSFSLHDAGDGSQPLCYAHIAFVSGVSDVSHDTNKAEGLDTGVLLNGIIGVDSTTNSGGWFKSGFGTRYANHNQFLSFVERLNSLHASAYTSSPFENGKVLTAALSPANEKALERIYDSANWVCLIDPKVDPLYFHDEEEAGNLLIIYYTDQESANGYDAITLTKKSAQYEGVIRGELAGVAQGDMSDHVRDVINFANAFNGTWLLSFLSTEKGYVPRSRMSTLAAIRVAVACYGHASDAVWIPLSLEEIFRVSTGLGLSAKDELLSWRNMGLDNKGPKSDDILLVGICGDPCKPSVILHPVEVKVGNCSSAEIQKGVAQASETYAALMQSYWGEERRDRLSARIARNSFMLKILSSAAKLEAYGVFPEANWAWVLDKCRTALQNEMYTIVDSESMGFPRGTLCAFKDDATAVSDYEDDGIRVIIVPSINISGITVGEMRGLEKYLDRYDYQHIAFDAVSNDSAGRSDQMPAAAPTPMGETDTKDEGSGNQRKREDSSAHNAPAEATSRYSAGESALERTDSTAEDQACMPASPPGPNGIRVLLGTDRDSGSEVFWEPCDTSKLFHTNTGIIGTMGTGKTQFTKSLIAQLYANRSDNPPSGDLGILIFDYKGDYNASQSDFVEATKATVYRPYHLPFNPLSINRSGNDLPLLPKHVANTFKDTLVRACSSSKLGAIQESTLYNFIMEAYGLKQIVPADDTTWDRTPPTFDTVYRLYMDSEDTKKNDSLAAIMDKIHEFEIFESDPDKTRSLYNILDGVVVVDLSGYDQDIQNLVVGITVDLFYSQMHANGHSRISGNMRELTKMILVDEADNFLSQGFPSLKKILKEGREFGVGTILSTQFLTHFKSKEDDYSKYILTWVVHNVADLDPSDIRFVFNTEAKSSEENYLFNEVKKLGKHCSMIKMGEGARPVPLRDKAFWEYWEEKESERR